MKLIIIVFVLSIVILPAFANVEVTNIEIYCPTATYNYTGLDVHFDPDLVICPLENGTGIIVSNTTSGNAIKLSLAPPTATRLGGVFASECPAGEFAYGITVLGTLLCAVP
jgi:hypothetical protein